MLAQSETWQDYSHHNTWKLLVGVTPNGQVSFLSNLSGWASLGQTNHKGRRCFGFKPGDNVMVDRGFDICKIVPDGVSVNMPPFLGDGNKWLRRKLSRQRVLGQCTFTWSVQSTELHCPTHLVHMPLRYQWSVGYWQTFFHLCWSQLKSHFMCLYHDATNFCSLWPGNVM